MKENMNLALVADFPKLLDAEAEGMVMTGDDAGPHGSRAGVRTKAPARVPEVSRPNRTASAFTEAARI